MKIRGLIALAAGLFLLGISSFVSYFLYQAMHGLNGHTWKGDAEMTSLTVRLLGLLFTFGIQASLTGSYMVWVGKVHRGLNAVMILLALGLIVTGFQITELAK